MDGQYYSFEFQPSSTANDVIEIIKKTIGLQEKSRGYAIYEVLGNTERSLSSEEKVCDVMAKWERYRTVSKKEYQNQVCNCFWAASRRYQAVSNPNISVLDAVRNAATKSCVFV